MQPRIRTEGRLSSPRSGFLLLLGILLTDPLSVSGATRPGLKLPALVGDHMVLQRDRAAVWGRDLPGQDVAVTLQGVRGAAKTNAAASGASS